MKDPYSATIRVSNTGKTEIKEEDFDTSIRFSSEGARVIAADVVETAKSFPEPHLELMSETSVAVDPALMNPDDWFEIHLLLDGEPVKFDAEARISGASISERASGARRTLLGRLVSDEAVRFFLLGTVIVTATGAFVLFVLTRNMTSVPDLVRLKPEQALFQLQQEGLHLDEQLCIESPSMIGRVVDQHPGPGETIEIGDRVAIVVAKHRCIPRTQSKS